MVARDFIFLNCQNGEHKWEHVGGCNAGCHEDLCCCSVPVHRCAVCGDYDYGDNAEAKQVRVDCWDRFGHPETRL